MSAGVSGIPLAHALGICAVLFALGVVGLLVRRGLLFSLMCLEIMLNATGLAFIVAGSRWVQPDGQIMFLMVLTLAAAEVAVGLALLLQIHLRFKTLDPDALVRMKG